MNNEDQALSSSVVEVLIVYVGLPSLITINEGNTQLIVPLTSVAEEQHTVLEDMTVVTEHISVVVTILTTEQVPVGLYIEVQELDVPSGGHWSVTVAVWPEQEEEASELVCVGEVDVESSLLSLFDPPAPLPSSDPLGGQLPILIPNINRRQNDGNCNSNASGRLGKLMRSSEESPLSGLTTRPVS
jgi:hypothetical protein